ncbi:MAG: hypothetical protein ACM3SX_08305, partial [Deltaproteobacteria bacterium]
WPPVRRALSPRETAETVYEMSLDACRWEYRPGGEQFRRGLAVHPVARPVYHGMAPNRPMMGLFR